MIESSAARTGGLGACPHQHETLIAIKHFKGRHLLPFLHWRRRDWRRRDYSNGRMTKVNPRRWIWEWRVKWIVEGNNTPGMIHYYQFSILYLTSHISFLISSSKAYEAIPFDCIKSLSGTFSNIQTIARNDGCVDVRTQRRGTAKHLTMNPHGIIYSVQSGCISVWSDSYHDVSIHLIGE